MGYLLVKPRIKRRKPLPQSIKLNDDQLLVFYAKLQSVIHTQNPDNILSGFYFCKPTCLL